MSDLLNDDSLINHTGIFSFFKVARGFLSKTPKKHIEEEKNTNNFHQNSEKQEYSTFVYKSQHFAQSHLNFEPSHAVLTATFERSGKCLNTFRCRRTD